jgi:cytochrome c-type biogenesis protein CcmH
MLIWALFAAMTILAVAIVVLPALRRRPAEAGAVEAGEVAVYRDQLAEIDRDLEAGLVGAVEAEAARAEISRRILRVGRHAEGTTGATGGSRAVPIAAAILLPLVAAGLYAKLGHPTLPDMPLAARVAAIPKGQSLEDLVAKVEAHLAAHPEDTRGWEVLAPTYTHLGRLDLAAAAWRNAIRTGGATSRRLDELGRTLTAAADDVVTPEARDAFEKSLELDPAGMMPRFYLAVSLTQQGKKAEAVEAWKAIVARATGAEPWLADAREELAKAEADLAGKPYVPSTPAPQAAEPAAPGAAGAPGPSAADVQAAAQMSPEDRAKMIESMVGRLRDRLAASGGTIEEWERLIRAENMLGQTEAAKVSLDKARAAFAGDAAALARLDALAGAKP